ncbi:MAG: radical SAM protein, partial [Candidatus Thorarchaeota archaeon]
MIEYEGSIWRPPSEARSLILQATVGCSHNACTFCVSYKRKEYKVRGAGGISRDLESLDQNVRDRVRRVFLADGNALAMDTNDMLGVLEVLQSELPQLERVGTYGYAKDVREKSVEELRTLREAGLGIVYLGLETGDDELLRWSRKGITTDENVEACLKIRNADIPLSLTIILGLGGLYQSKKHARLTAEALNEIDPEYIGALTLMIPPGTPLYEMTERNEFTPMDPFEILDEMKTLVEHLDLSECVFRTNHASNYLPIGGTLNKDRERILEVIESVLDGRDEKSLRPGYL